MRWEQGFPIDVRPILYAPGAGADKVGTPTGGWQIAMNPTARFNVKEAKATVQRPEFNNNAALHEALASSRLGKDIKCWLCHACAHHTLPPFLTTCHPLCRYNVAEGAMCLKISGHIEQVMNVVEDCKNIPQLGKLVNFSGIPEDFARTVRPAFKCYMIENQNQLIAEGINAVPVAAFLEEMGFDEQYPGLYIYEVKDQPDAEKMYADVGMLAQTWGFVLE